MEETRRSPWAVLIAAFLALLLVALPGKAWADETKWTYTDAETGIKTSLVNDDLGIGSNTVDITVIIDGKAVVTNSVDGVDTSLAQLRAENYEGFDVRVEGTHMNASSLGNGKYLLSFDVAQSDHALTVVFATEKTSDDIVISDGTTEYGTFSWSKTNATTAAYSRELTVYVNGEEKHTQTIYTPSDLTNALGNNQYWFTPNQELYMLNRVELNPATGLDQGVSRDVAVYIVTRCACGNDACLCDGGCDCPLGCTCDECTGATLQDNQINTGYGILEYQEPGTSGGYNLTVRVYVNGQQEFSTDDVNDGNPLRVHTGATGDLNFTPGNGYYYHYANGYDLYTKNSGSSWDQRTGYLLISGALEEDRNHDNILDIYLWTFNNHTTLDVERRVGDVTDNVEGYYISYEAEDPKTGETKTYTYQATSFEAGQTQTIPTGTPVTLTAKCKPGWEVDKWSTAEVYQGGVTFVGSEGNESETTALGNSATLTVDASWSTRVMVYIEQIGRAEAPTPEEVIDLVGEQVVQVECVNRFAGHPAQTYALGEDTFTVGAIEGENTDNVTVTVTVDDLEHYIAQYESDLGDVEHVADPTDQTVAFTLEHDGTGWKLDESTVPATITVDCDAEPAPDRPTFDDLEVIFGDELVTVDCTNDSFEHNPKNYGAIAGGVMIGDVELVDGVYTVKLDVVGAQYARQYGSDLDKLHWLDPDAQQDKQVTLTYNNDEKAWKAPNGFSPIEFTVSCADDEVVVPDLPTTEELAGIEDADVSVQCVTTDSSHGSVAYDPIAGAYSFGEIVDNADGTFSVEMTVNAAAYVEAFEAKCGEHELAANETDTKSITLVYTEDAWTVAASETPISFDVTCVEEAPEAPDMPTKDELDGIFGKAAVKIVCASNVGHADKAYGLIDGAYTVGAVVADAEGNYSCSVTVTPYTYIAQYSTDMEAAHTLADGESTSHVFALVYDGGWGLAEGVLNPVTFKAVCDAGSEQPTGPDAPTPEEIQELLVDGAVTIDCVNTEADHTDKTYEIAAGAYTIGDVVADDSGNYTVGITVAAGHYVLHYENDNEDIHHYLVDKTADEKVITLAYVDGKWTLPEDAAPVTFQVTCDPDGGSGDEDTPKPPTFDELFALIDVQLDCVNEEIDHPDSHNVLLDGSYELGVITGNAEKGFGITVAVDSAKYLEQYAAFFGEHKIAEGEDASKTVSLTYDNGWKLADGTDKATVPFNITCADGGSGDEGDKPESPTYEQLKQLIWVNLDCTNPSAGHRDSYTQLMRDTYTLGEVQEGNEGVYTLVVTVDSADYIAMYEEFYGDHQLAYGETDTKTVTLVYGEDGWAVQGDNIVTFDLTCYGGPDDDPDWPDWPDNPDDPDDPDQPDNPDDSDDPDTPDQPDDPDNPDSPDDPDIPDTPDQPGDDDGQDDPDQPGTAPGDDDGDKGDGCKPGNKPGDQGAGDKSDIPQTSDPFNPALVAVMGVAGIGLVGAGLYASRRRS